jgi:transcription elongation factor GreA
MNTKAGREVSYITQEKYDELKAELLHLTTVRRREIAESLEYARSLGDLKENAEYAEARDTQATVEDRIRTIEGILAHAEIVKAQKKHETVALGARVGIVRGKEKEVRVYEIVGPEEADVLENKLSHRSPLGSALLGKKSGDTFTFQTPSGAQEYTIVSLE